MMGEMSDEILIFPSLKRTKQTKKSWNNSEATPNGTDWWEKYSHHQFILNFIIPDPVLIQSKPYVRIILLLSSKF